MCLCGSRYEAQTRVLRGTEEELERSRQQEAKLQAELKVWEDKEFDRLALLKAEQEEKEREEIERAKARQKASDELKDEKPSAKLCRVLRLRLIEEESRAEELEKRLELLQAIDSDKDKQIMTLEDEQAEMARAVAASTNHKIVTMDVHGKELHGRDAVTIAMATNTKLRAVRDELTSKLLEQGETHSKQMQLIELLSKQLAKVQSQVSKHNRHKKSTVDAKQYELVGKKLAQCRKAYTTLAGEQKVIRRQLYKLRDLLPPPPAETKRARDQADKNLPLGLITLMKTLIITLITLYAPLPPSTASSS